MPKQTLWFLLLIWFLLLSSCKPSRSQTTTPSPAETPVPAIPVTPAAETPTPEPAVLLAFDFATTGQALGWKPTHDLRFSLQPASGQCHSSDNQGLHILANGGDPYMIGPDMEVDAENAYYVQVRMCSTAGNDAQLFWITRQDTRYDETKSQHFAVKGDGQWHTYQVPMRQNPAWTGMIVQLRLDPTTQQGSKIAIGWIRILGPRPGWVQARTFATTAAVVQATTPFTMCAQIVNAGDREVKDVSLALILGGQAGAPGLSLVSGSTELHLDRLASGEERQLAWQLRGPAGVYELSLVQGDRVLKRISVVVFDADADLVVLENGLLRLSFARQPYGYGVATFSRNGDNWHTLGRLRALGSLTWRATANSTDGADRQALLYADRVERITNGLRLPFQFTDAGGVQWSGESVFQVVPGGPWIDVRTTLQADADVQVVNWTGLAFYAGDGAFGTNKESALWPGIEFLLDQEQSSGTDFINPPANLRYIPHPLKVTVPLMAVTQGQKSVGLAWDPLQKWDGTHDRPGALFAAPNTWDGQDNQLMALFAPSPLDDGEENRIDSPSPYHLAAGQALNLQARLFAIPADTAAIDALSPLAFWLQTYGLPALPSLPRPYAQGIRLCLDATIGPTWEEKAQGWHYALHDPWGPGCSPQNELHLWLAALHGDLTADEQARHRKLVRELSQRTDYVGGQPNPLLHVPALYMHLADNDGLLHLARFGKSQLDGQNAEGFWPYAPQQRSGRAFGEAGDTSSGQIAANALYLLRFARITGDPALRESGLRALTYLEAHHSRRPEGAQVWELPLHCPDLLAAAWAEQCYLEAYRLTGERHYAERAQWWALSGLPFVYLWSSPDRPVMAYTTIPVFAATNYNYPWLGRPVMWNGLDYASGLWHLNQVLEEAGVSPIVDWRQVAEGITRAAMQMQPEAGSFLGMYPDAWDVVAGGEAYSWWLHPSYILHNLYLMQGPGAQVETVILKDGEQAVHVNAVADIVRAERGGDAGHPGRLEIELAYFAGETCVLMINRLAKAPTRVLLDGRPLTEIPSLARAPSGWLYREGTLVVKVPFSGERAVVVLEDM